MSKMIQIRNVPDDLHRRLKSQAAINGATLSDYLLEEIGRIADKPTLAELTRQIRADKDRHGAVRLPAGMSGADLIRDLRGD